MGTWTPSNLGSVVTAWWNAPDIATSDGTAVSSWSDKTGNGRAITQASGTLQPLYKTSIQNGLDVVRFDGTNDYLEVSDVGLSAQPYTFAAAVSYGGSLGVDERLWSSRAPVDNSLVRALSGGSFEIWGGGSVRGYGTAATGWHVHVCVFNGSSSSGSLDGTNTALATPGTGTPTAGIRVGTQSGAGAVYLGGDIGEMLFTNTAVSTADREKLEGYLAWKWGLQASLPGGHPYAGAAPTTTDSLVIVRRSRSRLRR